ncbi:MAG: alpha/beta fold hydrolase [Idiomarina sp.]|nr:alpha/beta fold hydrolase [Idiomarina sp.]
MGHDSTPSWLQELLSARPADNDAAWADWSANELKQFWKTVDHREVQTRDGIHLFYCVYEQPESSDWVVVSPGRIEAYVKYQEVILELAAAGYSVVAPDHRGQGYSTRVSHHHEHGHVAHFTDYVGDLATLMDRLAPQFGEGRVNFLGHSMGAAIVAMYLAGIAPKPRGIQLGGAVLSAPMLGINTKPWPASIGKSLVHVGAAFRRRFLTGRPTYFIGMKDYETLPFVENKLTHSKQRYQFFTHMYQDQPVIRVGGPTWQWLNEALRAADALQQLAPRIQVPVLVLQAGEDQIVEPEAQLNFVNKLTHKASTIHIVPESKHEILMEEDAIRHGAMVHVLSFFAAVQSESVGVPE